MTMGEEVPLRVVHKAAVGGAATLHPDDLQALTGEVDSVGSVWLETSGGSDCPVRVCADASIEIGTILMDACQGYNCRIASGDTIAFRKFDIPQKGFDLVECGIELRLSQLGGDEEPSHAVEPPSEGNAPPGAVYIDATELEKELGRLLCGEVLALNQNLTLKHGGYDLIARVSGTEYLELEDREDVIGYHCFRGLCTPDTRLFLSAPPSAAGISPQEPMWLTLKNARPPPGSSAPGTHKIRIITDDEEEFMVHRTLLRPCIELTQAVRAAGAAAPETGAEGAEVPVDSPPEAHVAVDCLNFDRVLLFLESQHLGTGLPHFPAHQLDGVLAAARALGLRSLEQSCLDRMGELVSRVRLYGLDELQRRNSAGECLLVIDGMVLDVTRWLPQHPGGSRIIPTQSLNVDATRFFELYHCTRESFLYLKELYVGELAPEDRHRLPPPRTDLVGEDAAEPSADFLEQLHRYTTFRMAIDCTRKNL